MVTYDIRLETRTSEQLFCSVSFLESRPFSEDLYTEITSVEQRIALVQATFDSLKSFGSKVPDIIQLYKNKEDVLLLNYLLVVLGVILSLLMMNMSYHHIINLFL